MKKEIFAVCDLDASYACNLMEYLNRRRSTPFEVQAFTNVESLCSCAKEHPIEILLISTKAMCDEIRALPISRTIILSEGEQITDPELPLVYKYQSSDQILSEVMEYYAEDHPQPHHLPTGTRRTKLYGVYSPISRSRKTSFALALGEILAESKRVLYLNFEEFAGFEELFQTKYRTDLTDLIYFSRQKENNLIYKFNSVVQTFHELEYIPPALSPSDIREVTADEWLEFLRELMDYREYEVILLDLSGQVNDLFRLMKECDRIYMPVQDDMISQAKLRQYEHLLHMLEMEEICEKTIKIRPPVQPLQADAGDLAQQLSWGEMGNYVRRLLWEEEQGNG